MRVRVGGEGWGGEGEGWGEGEGGLTWNLSEEKVAVPERPSCCWQRPSSPGLSSSGAPVSSESRSVPAHTATWMAGSSSAPTGWSGVGLGLGLRLGSGLGLGLGLGLG